MGTLVCDIAVFVPKRDVKLQPTDKMAHWRNLANTTEQSVCAAVMRPLSKLSKFFYYETQQ